MNPWTPWAERWRTLFKQKVEFTRIQPPVSLFLSRRFSYALMHAGEQRLLAVLDSVGDTPARYRQYQQELFKQTRLPVVFFITLSSSHQYRRLIEAGVSFITDRGHAYIPFFFLHLAPSDLLNPPSVRKEHLSPAAQALFLRQLLFGDIQGRNLRDIASRLGSYSVMTINIAKRQMKNLGLCTDTGSATRRKTEFPEDRETLWEKALPYLRTPVQTTYYIHTEVPLDKLPLAGESALSNKTLLGESSRPVYAVGKSQIRAFLSSEGIREVSEEEEANALIQHWKYDPYLLMSPQDKCVDSLSLYLSLQHASDDRVRQELNKLPLFKQ